MRHRQAGRAAALAAGLLLAACTHASSSASACGFVPSGELTAPAFAPRFHGTGTAPDSTWPSRIAGELASAPADSAVHVLFHTLAAVADSDRAVVRAYGATITDEPPDPLGIVATVTVAALRRLTSEVPWRRFVDVDLVTVTELPRCG